ncbi:zinc ABC transporter substrate-binding protein [Pantoea sp.]|uniref:zinc ABC transporter substrate-binding protein n=1 Tax=Pantoea sp. TaxID=69393 RepID=UPI0031E3B2E1
MNFIHNNHEDGKMYKNEVYVKMLGLALPYIRNLQRLEKKEKKLNLSCYLEAELVHNLTVTILDEKFTEHDIWFLNNQAKYYLEKCSEDISPNYNQHLKYIKELFSIVPDDLKPKLTWIGPK